MELNQKPADQFVRRNNKNSIVDMRSNTKARHLALKTQIGLKRVSSLFPLPLHPIPSTVHPTHPASAAASYPYHNQITSSDAKDDDSAQDHDAHHCHAHSHSHSHDGRGHDSSLLRPSPSPTLSSQYSPAQCPSPSTPHPQFSHNHPSHLTRPSTCVTQRHSDA